MKSSALIFVAVMATAGLASGKSQRPDPIDPKSATTPLRFETGLERLRQQQPEVDPAARWREHNDRVRAIGGHRGYVQRDSTSEAASAPARKP